MSNKLLVVVVAVIGVGAGAVLGATAAADTDAAGASLNAPDAYAAVAQDEGDGSAEHMTPEMIAQCDEMHAAMGDEMMAGGGMDGSGMDGSGMDSSSHDVHHPGE